MCSRVQPCAAPLLVHGLFVIVGRDGTLEVLIGCGPVVLGRYLLGVTTPAGCNVRREPVSELSRSRGPEVLNAQEAALAERYLACLPPSGSAAQEARPNEYVLVWQAQEPHAVPRLK